MQSGMQNCADEKGNGEGEHNEFASKLSFHSLRKEKDEEITWKKERKYMEKKNQGLWIRD